ncbi:MAG TPA: insecticidal toxin protein [Blastocatellia bacterium]|nr:insecticidal toxin protein [Blastocatellia bacterium]
MASKPETGFHNYYDTQVSVNMTAQSNWSEVVISGKLVTIKERKLSYQFYTHFHPYLAQLIQKLIEKSVPGLQEADTEYEKKADGSFVKLPDGRPRPVLYEELFTSSRYNPSSLVEKPHPVKDLDFTSSGAYSVYNWELFYHVPITIAIHLSKSQYFEEAMHWFHYVFDPTDNSDGPTPERFWKVKPFQFTDVKMIEEILVNLSSGVDPVLQQETINSIGAWKDAPFRPHAVARYRQSAYMFKAVMAYLDNLIAWGDSLFRQDTGETINEATQLYVLAANILGPRPQAVPKKGSVLPQTYANLRANLDKFGNVLREFEPDIPFDDLPHPNNATNFDQFATLRSIGNALYFCIPRNDKLLSYWDTVADRLFKIRNSLNIMGIFRQLPLFEPPIDPALLVKATAAGLDIGAVISGANQPLPLVRFQFLAQKAAEICQEVKSLGNNLLSSLEKEENEALAILRAKHERTILGMTETVKYTQWQEALKAREGLEKSLANSAQRYRYYERLLGRKENEINIPELDALDTGALQKMKFKSDEPELGARDIEVEIAQGGAGSLGSITGGTRGASAITGGKKLNSYEAKELNQLELAQLLYDASAIAETIGIGLGMIPQIGAKVQPVGAGVDATFGGDQLSRMFSMTASTGRAAAGRITYEASRASKIGNYTRREQEWAFQSNLAAGEITQLFKQLRAAQLREAIAEMEWKNHHQQILNAEEIEQFFTNEKTGKKSNQTFYAWMKREVRGLYTQCFQFAFDIARKAERALQNELGNSQLSFLQFNYMGGKEGLLAGEKLYLDIKRMEMAYHDLNQREYELTKHVSLLQINPQALLQLRMTGRCAVFLPEESFDMDCPGHYFRRIKSVAVTIPCVVGPYTSVNCALTLLKSTVRKSPLLRDGSYSREGAEDDRFSDHFGSLQSIVTSTGQNDGGMFDMNLRDDHYLPFEGAGAVSEWQLELPTDVRQFDYNTISDVIIHLRYTAREGGNLLKSGAIANLKSLIEEAKAAGSVRLFSVRHEFPTEWAKFTSVKLTAANPFAELSLNLRSEHYPFWSQGRLGSIKQVDLFAKTTKASIDVMNKPPDGTEKKDTLIKDNSLGNLTTVRLKNIPLPTPTGKYTLWYNDNSMQDLWLALAWGKA